MSGTNPLQHWDPDPLVKYAATFYQAKKLAHIVELEDFIKGALYYRDPGAVDTTPIDDSAYLPYLHTNEEGQLNSADVHIDRLKLTDIDIQSIKRHEQPGRLQKWGTLPRGLRLIRAACALAAVTQGWDQSSMNAANLGWTAQKQLNLPIDDIIKNPSVRNVWLFGLINGAPFFVGSVVSFFFTDPFSNKKVFGRRLVLYIAGVFSFASVLGSAGTRTWQQLLVCRLLLGIGMGTGACIVPILLSEVSPTDIRGMTVTTWQMFDSLGIFLGFLFNLICCKLDHDQYWRWMLGVAALPAFVMFFIIPFCPESPRWLLRQGRVDDALKSLLAIHPVRSDIIACGDLLYIYESLHHETNWLFKQAKIRPTAGAQALPFQQVGDDAASDASSESRVHEIKPAGIRLRWRVMTKSQRMRSANYASLTVMLAQQLCGINLLAFLSSTFYYSLVKQGAPLAQLPSPDDIMRIVGLGAGFGAVNFTFSAIAFLCIDWRASEDENAQRHSIFGWWPKQITRRTLLNISFPLMAVFLLIAGLILLAKPSRAVAGAHFAMLYLFTAAYSVGEGPMAFLISAEVYPLVNPEIGMSFAVFWNFIGAGVLSVVAPILTHATHHWGVFVIFCGGNLVCWVACYLTVPQTQGRNTENIFTQQDEPLGTLVSRRWNKLLIHLHIRKDPVA